MRTLNHHLYVCGIIDLSYTITNIIQTYEDTLNHHLYEKKLVLLPSVTGATMHLYPIFTDDPSP